MGGQTWAMRSRFLTRGQTPGSPTAGFGHLDTIRERMIGAGVPPTGLRHLLKPQQPARLLQESFQVPCGSVLR